jgi:hypothetical protein
MTSKIVIIIYSLHKLFFLSVLLFFHSIVRLSSFRVLTSLSAPPKTWDNLQSELLNDAEISNFNHVHELCLNLFRVIYSSLDSTLSGSITCIVSCQGALFESIEHYKY